MEKVNFKPRKAKNLRKRLNSEDGEEEEVDFEAAKLEEAKAIQNLRKRPHGVNIISLAIGAKVTTEDEGAKDPFKAKSGGMINMQALKSGKVTQVDDAYDTGIGTQFSVETNKLNGDDEMMKYIEMKLPSATKEKDKEVDTNTKKMSYLSPEEEALQAVPSHLRESSTKRSEEMLSYQMLNGIPEIDLGIEAKIKNIEATEEAKLKLLWEKQNKKDGPSQFVPTNMAVNFVQHNRFNLDHSETTKKKPKVECEPDKPKKKDEKATDDYYYERFKKQFRR